MKLADFPDLRRLTAKEKLKLSEELWLDAVSDQSLPVPDSHKEILNQRIARYKAGKEKTISIAELKRRLRFK